MCADRVKDIQTSEEGGGKTVDKRSTLGVGLKTLGRFFLFSSFEILQTNKGACYTVVQSLFDLSFLFSSCEMLLRPLDQFLLIMYWQSCLCFFVFVF